MAHKAKSKKNSKTDSDTKTRMKSTKNLKKGRTQETNSEQTPETQSTRGWKAKEEKKKNLQSFSLKESAIQVAIKPIAKVIVPHDEAQYGKAAITKPNFHIIHKKDKGGNKGEIVGRKAFTKWKKSSGRNKSWAVCRRFKLSCESLELLIQSKNRPVSLGWRFSSVVSPVVFVRSQGVRIYELPENKTKRSLRGKEFADEDVGRRVVRRRSRNTDVKVRKWRPEIKHQDQSGVAFLRLTFDHGRVSMTQEAFLKIIILSTSSEPTEDPGPFEHAELVVIRLLRNESHADIYLVKSPSIPSRFYHAHAFLTDISGNWSTFSRRKMDRLKKAQGFYAETIQQGRKIIIMEVDWEAKVFSFKNTQQEFPLLPGTVLRPPTKMKKNRPSYAAVVIRGERKRHTISNHRAYKAWEKRKGKGLNIIALDKAPTIEPRSGQPKKTGTFKTRGRERR